MTNQRRVISSELPKTRHKITGLRRLSMTPDLNHAFLTIDCEEQSFDFSMHQTGLRILAAELSAIVARIDASEDSATDAPVERH